MTLTDDLFKRNLVLHFQGFVGTDPTFELELTGRIPLPPKARTPGEEPEVDSALVSSLYDARSAELRLFDSDIRVYNIGNSYAPTRIELQRRDSPLYRRYLYQLFGPIEYHTIWRMMCEEKPAQTVVLTEREFQHLLKVIDHDVQFILNS